MSRPEQAIYIASRARHGGLWQETRARGVQIVSTWINEWQIGQTDDYRDLWVRNIAEASAASALVGFRELGEPLKGALVEIGAALGNGVPVFFVGSVDGYSFEAHPLFHRCATLDEAFDSAAAFARAPSVPSDDGTPVCIRRWDPVLRQIVFDPFPEDIHGDVHGSAGTESGEIEAATTAMTRAGLEPATYGLKGPQSNAGETPTDAEISGSTRASSGDERRSAPENGSTSPDISPEPAKYGFMAECGLNSVVPPGEVWFVSTYADGRKVIRGKLVGVRV